MTLDPQQVRAALAAVPRRTLVDPRLCPAAVLLPLICQDDIAQLLFLRRAEQLRHHRGEIAFPGGACDPDDADAEATALRESTEELGLAPASVTLLGRLDDFVSVHDYRVTPVVGRIAWPQPLQLAADEVAEAFVLPLRQLAEPQRWHKENWRHRGRLHPVHFCRVDGYEIWGLTAAILRQFLKRLALLPPPH